MSKNDAIEILNNMLNKVKAGESVKTHNGKHTLVAFPVAFELAIEKINNGASVETVMKPFITGPTF